MFAGLNWQTAVTTVVLFGILIFPLGFFTAFDLVQGRVEEPPPESEFAGVIDEDDSGEGQEVVEEIPVVDLPELIEITKPVRRAEVGNKVALTFDDGPHPKMTAEYLAVLAEHDVSATFFVLGDRAELYPEQIKHMVDRHHEVGSHSWGHGLLDKLKTEALVNDLTKATDSLTTLTAGEIRFLRPPYGRYSPQVEKVAGDLGQHIILWDVDPKDWDKPSVDQLVTRVMDHVKPGSIILLHEGKANTLKALPAIITQLRERGLEPVSLSHLLAKEEAS